MASKYEGIVRSLSQQITTMQRGDQLPTEIELSQQFGVSPMTVRRALGILIDSGRLKATRGKGTFVLRPGVMNRMEMVSFTQAVKSAGMVPRTQVLSTSTLAADDEVAESLEIQPGETVYRISRLRFADESPIAIETNHVSAQLYPGLLDLDITKPFGEVLTENYGTRSATAENRIGAVLPDEEEARLLGIGRGVACVRVHTKRYETGGRVEQLGTSIFRGDLWEIMTEQEFG